MVVWTRRRHCAVNTKEIQKWILNCCNCALSSLDLLLLLCPRRLWKKWTWIHYPGHVRELWRSKMDPNLPRSLTKRNLLTRWELPIASRCGLYVDCVHLWDNLHCLGWRSWFDMFVLCVMFGLFCRFAFFKLNGPCFLSRYLNFVLVMMVKFIIIESQ
jgi:hypothetical protein